MKVSIKLHTCTSRIAFSTKNLILQKNNICLHHPFWCQKIQMSLNTISNLNYGDFLCKKIKIYLANAVNYCTTYPSFGEK